MSKYEPELGQMAFGQSWQRLDADESLLAALTLIDAAMGAADGPRYSSPFQNTGARFDCETFSAHAYSWDDSQEQEWNFRWRDLRVSWYKHYRRGTSVNRDLTTAEVFEMLWECVEAVG